MSSARLMFPKILGFEGIKYTDDKVDKGGATKIGVTLKTWRACGYDKDGDGDIDADDIKTLTTEDALMVFDKFYWKRCKADQINNQSVAEAIVDWVWTSGKWGIVHTQRILGLVDDGVVGDKTIKAINLSNSSWLHLEIQAARIKFIDEIVRNNPSQSKYIRGWKNRVNKYKFEN